MTQSREFYAATVEEAIGRAVASTGVSRDELSYEVLDEGSTGFLGIGARDARVLVQNIPVSAPEPVNEEEAPEEMVPEAATTPIVSAEEPSPTEGPGAEEGPREPGAQETDAEQVTVSAELLEEIKDLVASLLVAMGFKAGVDVYDAGDYIAADVTPDNTGLFIGQKGETIDAVQYLINASVYRERPFIKRVVLDAEGYRQRRVEAVQGLAHRTARRVIREGQPVELPSMNASERRVVHLYLKDNPEVVTASEGNGDDRKVRISPSEHSRYGVSRETQCSIERRNWSPRQ